MNLSPRTATQGMQRAGGQQGSEGCEVAPVKDTEAEGRRQHGQRRTRMALSKVRPGVSPIPLAHLVPCIPLGHPQKS